MTAKPQVGVLMGSDSDYAVMQQALETLEDLEIPFEVRVLSAHRSPELACAYAAAAERRNLRVVIAGAGGAAHLAGIVAAHTVVPVLGVPVGAGDLFGLTALLSMVQMPPGVPVGTLGVGPSGARNAALLAARILATTDKGLRRRLLAFRRRQTSLVLEKDRKVQERWASQREGG